MTKGILIGIAWLGTLVGAHFITSSMTQKATPASKVEQQEIRLVEAEPRREVVFVERPSPVEGQPAPLEPNEESNQIGDQLSIADIERGLPLALGNKDVAARDLAVANMLSQLTAENAPAMAAAFGENDRELWSDPMFKNFMYAWGLIDGRAAAADAFKRYGCSNSALSRFGSSAPALRAWGMTDPIAALEFLKSDETYMTAGTCSAVMYGFARGDLAGAQNYMAGLEAGELRDRAVATVMGRHSRSDNPPKGLLDWASETLATSQDPDLIKDVLKMTTRAAAMNDGEPLANWIDQHANSEYVTPTMFEDAAEKWAQSDPTAAASWLEQHMEDERVTSKEVGKFVGIWTRTDPQSAVSWLNQNMNARQVSPELTGLVAAGWARDDPDSAVAWAESLPPEMQEGTFKEMIWGLRAADIPKAFAWLDRAGSDATYDAAKSELATRTSSIDPVKSIEIANSITDPKIRERSMIAGAQTMIKRQPEAIEIWLPLSGLSEAAQKAILTLDYSREGLQLDDEE